jgi:hypothetical protein
LFLQHASAGEPGVSAAPSAKKAKPDLLTPKTRWRIESVDSAMGGGWLDGHLQDFLEMVIAEGWTAELPKRFLAPTIFYSQFVRLKSLQEPWITEDNPKPSREPETPENGLTDDKPKRGRKIRPHPLFGETPPKGMMRPRSPDGPTKRICVTSNTPMRATHRRHR